MNRRKVGIMGGTFDPIHIGHLILGESAWEQFGLERVLFMPSGNPPHKTNRQGASNEQRVEMVRRAIASNEHFELSLAGVGLPSVNHAPVAAADDHDAHDAVLFHGVCLLAVPMCFMVSFRNKTILNYHNCGVRGKTYAHAGAIFLVKCPGCAREGAHRCLRGEGDAGARTARPPRVA